MYKKSISSLPFKNIHQAFNNKEESIKLQAPRPCDRCRKHRIKCNRSLSGCAHCTKNSIPCEYKYIPKKRGPKSKLDRDCDYLRDVNKKYNNLEKACMLNSEFNATEFEENSTQLSSYAFTPIQQLPKAEEFDFESMNLSMPISNIIPPIVASQHFDQNYNAQDLNSATLNSADPAQGFSMPLSPNLQQQQDFRLPFSPNFQALSAFFSASSQESYIQTANSFSPNSQDHSISPSSELNQFIFEASIPRQEAFQIPSTTLIDNCIPQLNTLDPNYWLPLPPTYFISTFRHSKDSFQLNPNHNSIIF
jgi:hypothetical protein